MKKSLILTVLILLTTFFADQVVSDFQARVLEERAGGEAVFELLSAKISKGMQPRDVETTLEGFRSKRVNAKLDGYTVSYGYWVGFIPPRLTFGLKYWGEIVVRFSSEGKVVNATYWYN